MTRIEIPGASLLLSGLRRNGGTAGVEPEIKELFRRVVIQVLPEPSLDLT